MLLAESRSLMTLDRVQSYMVRHNVPVSARTFHAMLSAVLHRFPMAQLAQLFDVVDNMRLCGLAETDQVRLALMIGMSLSVQTRFANRYAWKVIEQGIEKYGQKQR